jgi:phage baseplate assembly protein W
MAADDMGSFLGSGWSFPPEFPREASEVRMSHDDQDVAESLRILFGTALGERFLVTRYGLDMRTILFDPLSTTMRTFLKERIATSILVYEPRIRVLALEVSSPDPNDGRLLVSLEYEIRATNSRYNLVFPFYRGDANEVRGRVAGPRNVADP